MKYLCMVLLIGLLPFLAIAQNNDEELLASLKDKVVVFINNKQADSIYALAGADFQKALTKEMLRSFLESQIFPLGVIKSTEFEKYQDGVSRYKAIFDKRNLSMFLGVDGSNKLNTFLFKPYKEKPAGPIVRVATDNKLTTVLDKKIDSIIQSFMFSNKTVGMSIGIMQNDKFYYYNYGETQKGNNILPTADNLYEIGSLTKTFTGLLLAEAVVAGKMKLNDPVNIYLPKDIPVLKFGNDTVKLVHLANHTSGLPALPLSIVFGDKTNPYKSYDRSQLYSFLKDVKLLSKPGDISKYSNLGVGLLGVLLENVYNKSYESLIKEFITSKAGMQNTVQNLTGRNKGHLVQGYTENIVEQGPWDFMALAGAGALRSNVKDMLLYARFNMGENPKNSRQNEALKIAHTVTYQKNNERLALNWYLQNWGNGELLFHGGQTGGYKSFIAINSKTKNAVILLSNTSVSHDEQGVEIMNFLDTDKIN